MLDEIIGGGRGVVNAQQFKICTWAWNPPNPSGGSAVAPNLPSVRVELWRETVATASDLSSPSPGNRSPGFEGAGWLMAIEG